MAKQNKWDSSLHGKSSDDLNIGMNHHIVFAITHEGNGGIGLVNTQSLHQKIISCITALACLMTQDFFTSKHCCLEKTPIVATKSSRKIILAKIEMITKIFMNKKMNLNTTLEL